MTHHQHTPQPQTHRSQQLQAGQPRQPATRQGKQRQVHEQQPQTSQKAVQTQQPQGDGGQQLLTEAQSQQQPVQQSIGQEQLVPAFETANFLGDEVRAASVEVLNQVLADTIVVVSQIEGAHWNVRGPEFYQLHELFEDVAEAVEDHVDDVAERATALGGTARGTVQQAARQTTLPALPEHAVTGPALLQHVAQALSTLDATLYQGMETVEARGDLDTVDLLNEVSRDVSKSLWFVEAHLQGTRQGQALGQRQ